MSTKDKARNKLLGSMRKTKETAESKPAAAHEPHKAAPKAESKPAAAKKAAAKKAAPKKSEAVRRDPPKPITGAFVSSKPSSDPFQSAGRIWPD